MLAKRTRKHLSRKKVQEFKRETCAKDEKRQRNQRKKSHGKSGFPVMKTRTQTAKRKMSRRDQKVLSIAPKRQQKVPNLQKGPGIRFARKKKICGRESVHTKTHAAMIVVVVDDRRELSFQESNESSTKRDSAKEEEERRREKELKRIHR